MARFRSSFDFNLTVRPLGIYGTEQADNLTGTALADTIHGLGGNDTVHGGNGNDLIFGDAGNDRLYGDAGNDTLIGGTGADTLVGGTGTDTAAYTYATGGVMLDLATGGILGEAAGDTYSGIENVTGSAYGDIINGNQSANVIQGELGDDYLFGQGGNDHLLGGYGSDVLRGGAGNDRLDGGALGDRLTGDDQGSFGYDTFVMAPHAWSNGDIITDFQRGFDHIDVSAFNFVNALGADGRLAVGPTDGALGPLGGVINDDNVPIWSSGLDADDRLVFDPGNSTLYAVNVAWSNEHQGYFVASRVEIAILQGVTDLSAADLILHTQNFTIDTGPIEVLA